MRKQSLCVEWMGRLAGIALGAILAMAGAARAGDSNQKPTEPNFECIGSYGEEIRSCEQYGHYVFLNQGYTLRVLDIQDPKQPKESAWLRYENEIHSLAIRGKALYVEFEGEEGIYVYDVSDPTHPRRCAKLEGGGRWMSREFLGDYLLTEARESRMVDYKVYDIRNPLNPIKCIDGMRDHGSANKGDFCIFATDGKRLFFAEMGEEDQNGDMTVAIQDMSTSPTTLAWRKIPSFENVKFSVNAGKLNVTDTITTTVTPVAQINRSDTVWIYEYENGILVEQEGIPNKSATPGKNIPKSKKQAIRSFKDTNGTTATFPCVYGNQSGAEQFKIAGKRGYLVDSKGGLQILDLSDPGRPRFQARHTMVSNPVIRAIEDDLVFLGGKDSGFRVLDCTHPTSPTLRGQYSGTAGPMSIQGKRAYVAAGHEGLQILDISNIAAIRSLGRYPTPNSASDLATSESLVYLLAKDLLIVDVADPAKPVLVGSTPIAIDSDGEERHAQDEPMMLKKLGPALYIVKLVERTREKGAIVIVCDVSHPARPRVLPDRIDVESSDEDDTATRNRIRTGALPLRSNYSGWFLCLPSSYHHIGSWDVFTIKDFTVFDLSNPLNPIPIFQTSAVQTDDRVALYKNTIYLADGPGGLVILRPVQKTRSGNGSGRINSH